MSLKTDGVIYIYIWMIDLFALGFNKDLYLCSLYDEINVVDNKYYDVVDLYLR
jgi:hypothetical protein